MDYFPTISDFTPGYDTQKPQLVWTRLSADLDTPVAASMKLLDKKAPFFLLESVQGGESRGRYSIIGLQPDMIWRYHGNQAELCRTPDASDPVYEPLDGPPLDELRSLLQESRIEKPEELPPMASGWIGYLGYETIGLVEDIPITNPDETDLPDGCLMRPRIMVIFDGVADEIIIVTPVYPEEDRPADIAYESALMRLSRIADQLEHPLPRSARAHNRGHVEPLTLDFTSNLTRNHYHSMVEKAREHIFAGDIFQIVPSQRFSAAFPLDAFAFYRSLRHLNPSPFLFYLNFGTFQLVGSSPEIMVRLRDDIVTIRPIAGTRKRGASAEEDQALEEDLLRDPKEIAEHLMLLDLGRNDVGRVAAMDSVTVTEQMVIERYSHVMHIVSNVIGRIDKDKDALDALMAGFPAGTVSGAPKIRAMEIINELETIQRKFYGGCVGYFSGTGAMDSCIALRTALIKDGHIHIQAGGGVVADSDPEAEYQESYNKARALMHAAEQASRFG